jgi:hypothetical protein
MPITPLRKPSELDGWWAEAYTPAVGWSLGDGKEHGDDPAWDAIETEALYDLLEREVIPEVYQPDKDGIPTAWASGCERALHGSPHASSPTARCVNIPSDITGRLRRPIISAQPIKAPWAGKWSIGDTG